MEKQNKKLKKEINKLVEKAHEKELEKELSRLAKNFTEWQKKEMDSFELIDKIHDFHDGTSREIWKRYHYMKSKLNLIALAIIEGNLNESEVSNELMKKLEPIIQLFKE